MKILIIFVITSMMRLSPLPNKVIGISHSDIRHGKFLHFTDGTRAVPDPERTKILRDKDDTRNSKTY